MHRNQQRKEQQLDRFRHLRQIQNESSLQSSPQQLSRLSTPQSPQQSSARGVARLQRHNSAANAVSDALHSNSSLRSAAKTSAARQSSLSGSTPLSSPMRTPSVAPVMSPQTSTPLSKSQHSRARLSPNGKINTSLPQAIANSSLSRRLSSASAQTITNNENPTKQLSLGDNESEIKSMATTPEPNLSPEILFLIKEQAKAIAKINALQKKVEKLEFSLKSGVESRELSRDVLSASSSKSVNTSKDRNIVSDDSGGEYSRATTTVSDEDELSSLLDQIARCSQQLTVSQHHRHNSSQQHNRYKQPNSNLLPQSMQTRQKPTYLSVPALRMSLQSPLVVDTQKDCHQSISALLFEPNIETVLKNIDDIVTTERKASTSQLLSAFTSAHSSSSLYDGTAIAATGVSAASLAANSSTNWQLERVKSIIKQREEQEFSSQMRLADQWLQTHLNSGPIDQQKINNYIDSLETSNFR